MRGGLPDALDLGRRPRRRVLGHLPADPATTRPPCGRPDQGTGPNVFYLGASHAVLDPLEAPVQATPTCGPSPTSTGSTTSADFTGADPTAHTTLNTAHPRPWGWRVITYLWAKGLGAGALFVAALAAVLDVGLGAVGDVVAPVIAAAGGGGHRRAAGVGPQAARALLLPLHARQPRLVAGARRLLRCWASGPRPPRGSSPRRSAPTVRSRWLALPVRAAVGAGRRLHGVPVRPGRGPRPVAVDLGCYRTCWPRPRWSGAGAMAVVVVVADVGADGIALVARTLVDRRGAAPRHHGPRPRRRGTRADAAVAARTIVRGRYRTAVLVAAPSPRSWRRSCWPSPSWSGDHGWAVLAAGVLVQAALLAYETVYVRAAQDVPLS